MHDYGEPINPAIHFPLLEDWLILLMSGEANIILINGGFPTKVN
jgi:hypothetical protein